MIFRLCIVWLVAVCAYFSASAQRFHFIPYSVNEGLAQSQVRDIVQSNDGYLWIATVGGMSRFDGIMFKTYNKANGLPNNLANAIHKLPSGGVATSYPGGVAFFTDSGLTTYQFDSAYSNVLVNDFLSNGNTLVMGSNGRGLLYFENGQIVDQLDLGSNDLNFVRCLSQLNGELVAGTRGGLVKINSSGRVTIINDSISVNSIVSSGAKLWISTNGDGLLSYENGELVKYGRELGLANIFVRDISIDHKGNPWLVSNNSIQKFDLEGGRFITIQPFDPELSTNMRVILHDTEQNIWVGTDGFGILKFTGNQFEIYGTHDGLSSNIVMDIDQGVDSTFYFATYGAGVSFLKDQKYDTIALREGLMNRTVWCILPVGKKVWVGTSNGIHIWDGNRANEFSLNSKLPYQRIANLFEDSHGRIWIATREGVRYFKDDSLVLPSTLKQFDLGDCKDIAETPDAIWITSDKGLVRYNSDGSAEVFSKSNGLPENYITCIEKGLNDNLWLGSEEGIIHFDTKSEDGQLIAISDKVSSNIINFLQNEADQRLWIGTDNGLFVLDLLKFETSGVAQFKGFNQHDGVVSNECNQNASFYDYEGNVWFGTNGGLLKYKHSPQSMQRSRVIGVDLNDVQINFESVIEDIDRHADAHDKNKFDYNQNRITFRYSAIHFSNPDKVVYSYRLIGLDEDWSPETRESYVTFSNLSPGEYSFEVRSKVGGGEWKECANPVKFYISPPFWLRWWFIALVIFAIVSILFFAFKQYEKQQQRKRQLSDMQTKAKVLGLEQQTLNAHMNRHFIFNALNSIQYYINTQDRKQANQYLTNFASLVRKNLDSAQTDSINLKDELERLTLYINLEQMRFKDRFTFEIKVDPSLDVSAIQVPSMILQPFVENSIMHGILPSERMGKISISVQPHTSGIKFIIDDNGIGIETSYQNKSGTSLHVSNGMKITKQRIEIIAKAMNGTYGVFGPFQLTDNEGKALGTRVEIILPQNFQRFKAFYEKNV